MEDKKNPIICVYKKHHGHPQGGFWLFLTWQASLKKIKIHPLGDHTASYTQQGWGFIYSGLVGLNYICNCYIT